ncbi:MAG TPA: DmsE family decaheme c-type cytochrome, partial [Thermoanaerobaculia bacterium]
PAAKPAVQQAAPAATEPQPAKAAEQTKAAEPQAAMSCSDCHDQAKAFVNNAHAIGKVKADGVPNAVCESCHGDATAHIEGGGDKEKIYKPVGRAGADKTCLKCHDTATDKRSAHTGVHANSAAVNCLTCHSVHGSDPNASHLLVKAQPQLCANCHATQAASLRNKPYAHRIGRAGMECTSCHEPHGRAGQTLKVTNAGEAICVSCHAEQRGPFVFTHGANSLGECTNCHEPHGSSNAKQLKRASVQQLCIECHSPISATTLGSQAPSFHNLSDVRYQNCTTCHVAVHGSNRSPQLTK